MKWNTPHKRPHVVAADGEDGGPEAMSKSLDHKGPVKSHQPGEIVTFNTRLPKLLHRNMKIACAMTGKTVALFVEEAIQEKLKKSGVRVPDFVKGATPVATPTKSKAKGSTGKARRKPTPMAAAATTTLTAAHDDMQYGGGECAPPDATTTA
jgi:hypothetical protein